MMRNWRLSLGLTATLGLAGLAGCDRPVGTNAGFTNGPAPGGTEKPAVRDDLPLPSTSGRGEALGQAGDNHRDSGPGGNGGGTEGGQPQLPKGGNPDSVRANPPADDTGASAAGATKAPDTIKTGTPRGPQ